MAKQIMLGNQLKLSLRYLPYFGGKRGSKLGGWIFNNFNLEGIDNYVEPFSGMFGIYLGDFSDFSKVKNIVYNDIDLQNCNVMSCAQVPLAFLTEIHNSLKVPGGLLYYSGLSEPEIFEKFKELYKEYHKGIRKLPEVPVNVRDYQTALIYSFLRLHSMKSMHFLTVGPKNKYFDNWYKRYKLLQPLVNRLKNHNFVDKVARISVNNKDFEAIMNKYNSEKSFIYLDPPYFDRELLYDAEEKGVFGEEDHLRLAEAIDKTKARIALSYYHFDGIEKLYPKNKYRYEIKTFYNSAAGKYSDELLIMNYPEKINNDYNSGKRFEYKGAYFDYSNERYELIIPDIYDKITSVITDKQIEYNDDDKLTIEVIRCNDDNIYLGNTIENAIKKIDDCIIVYESNKYNL